MKEEKNFTLRMVRFPKFEFAGLLNYLIGEKEKIKGKGLYFVRTTPPHKAVNPNNGNDNEVLFGEISEHTVTSLNIIINNVFKPLVDRLDPV
jgi:hypothetical protein